MPGDPDAPAAGREPDARKPGDAEDPPFRVLSPLGAWALGYRAEPTASVTEQRVYVPVPSPF